MEQIIIFAVLSIPLVILSWRTLFSMKSHGLYRFLAWECMAWLVAANYRFWFNDPASLNQLFSWICLLLSIYMVIAGVILLKRSGKPENKRTEKELYQFERTTQLVETGIYKYIRHPLYSSLLFLSWGIFLKNISAETGIIAVLSSVFLYFTALSDEKECTAFFGEKYTEYMKRTKRFIPFIL